MTVGQEVRGADLAERINDLAFALCGQRPAISDLDAAGGLRKRRLSAAPRRAGRRVEEAYGYLTPPVSP